MAGHPPASSSGRDGRNAPAASVRRKNGGSFAWSAPLPSPSAVEEMERLFPEILQLPTTAIDRESEDWVASGVIARSLSRWIPPDAVLREFRRAGIAGRIDVIQLAHRILLLKFELMEARSAVLMSPWTVNGQVLAMEPWHADFIPADDAVSAALIWIRLPNLPIEYWSEETLRSILSVAGSFVECDSFTKQRKRGSYARASVRLDLRSPLRPGARLRSNGAPFWQPFVYEQVDCICSHCGSVHLSGSCILAAAPGNSAAGPSFGPWMSAIRSRKAPIATANSGSSPPSAPLAASSGPTSTEKTNDAQGWMKPGKSSRRKALPSSSQSNVAFVNSPDQGCEAVGGSSSEAMDDQGSCRFLSAVPVTVHPTLPLPKAPVRLDGGSASNGQSVRASKEKRSSSKDVDSMGNQSQNGSIFLFGTPASETLAQPSQDSKLKETMVKPNPRLTVGRKIGSQPPRVFGADSQDFNLKTRGDANPGSLKRARPSENVGPRVLPKALPGKLRGTTLRKGSSLPQNPSTVHNSPVSAGPGVLQLMDVTSDPLVKGCPDSVSMEPLLQQFPGDRDDSMAPDQGTELECSGAGDEIDMTGEATQIHHFDVCVLLETRLSGRSLQLLRGRLSRSWASYAIEANGLSGGILALWRNPDLKVEAFHQNNQQVGLLISEGITPPWLLLGVYASTDYQLRRDLWAEIITLLDQGLPTLVAGDFNCILEAAEKRGGRRFVDSPNSVDFRSFIAAAGLMDLGFSGPQFTWCNNRSGSARVWERLDRALASPSWLQAFPAATVTHLSRIASDHRPLLISLEANSFRKGPFRFEQLWTHYASTRALILQVWHMPIRGNPSYRISRRLELTRRRLLRWHRTEVGDLNQKIQAAEAIIDTLQTKEDSEGFLADSDLQSLRHTLDVHHSLLSQQEIYWRQRSRVQWIKEGDRNTKFFHQATVARRAANRIRQITNLDGTIIEDEEAIREHLLQFFRSCWSDSPASSTPTITPILGPRVSDIDNRRLCREVTTEEIRTALWALGPDKAPGPDGFSPFFFRYYWDIVGKEVVMAVQSVFSSRTIPADWQRTYLALIPKKGNALLPQHFRPISLCTTLYKVCARILVMRLQSVIPRLISAEQGAFIRGRSITDNVFIAQEFMHDLRKASSRQPLMAIQLDMERAYDRMSWTFLRHTLLGFGFDALFIDWIMACVQGTTFSIIINGSPTEFFHSVVGLRQGCPLSPYLFILCADDLSRALAQAVGVSRLQPFLPGSSGPPLTHLLFADDCILLSPASVQNAATCHTIIQSYCLASGQKVNLQKSLISFSPSTSRRLRHSITQLTGISASSDCLSYLGIPISGRRPRQQDFGDLDRRISARMDRWQVSCLSMMGRLTLIRSILTSLPIYLLSNTLIPITFLRRIERRIRDFLWASSRGGHGIHLLDWDTVCTPICEGGLGIQSLLTCRKALMARHASRFLLDPTSLWSSIMRSRYGDWSNGETPCAPRGCSWLWRAICQAAPTIMPEIQWSIGDGTTIDIIQDAWAAQTPFSRWPTFISVDVEASQPVSSLICQEDATWNSSTVYSLFGPDLATRILAMPLPLSAGRDVRLWRRSCLPIAPTRDLSSRYRPQVQGCADVEWIWRLPVHPRVQLFLWKLGWDRLPTCSMLAGRGLDISPLCPICGLQIELIDHVLFLCHRASQIWQLTSFSPWPLRRDSLTLSFLHAVREATQRGPRFQGIFYAYLVYHIWLSRNRIIFDGETTLPHVILRRAYVHAREYSIHRPGVHLDRPGHWGPIASSGAHRSTVFVSWEPPPPGYVKVNFDGSVTGRSAGAGFVIRGAAGQFIAAGGHSATDTSVPLMELQAAWAAISHSVCQLGHRRLIIEGDSLTVIRWLSEDSDPQTIQHPLIRDIRVSLQSTTSMEFRHIYREANSAADWVASAAARQRGTWIWQDSACCPSIFRQIMYSDSMGLTRARMV